MIDTAEKGIYSLVTDVEPAFRPWFAELGGDAEAARARMSVGLTGRPVRERYFVVPLALGPHLIRVVLLHDRDVDLPAPVAFDEAGDLLVARLPKPALGNAGALADPAVLGFLGEPGRAPQSSIARSELEMLSEDDVLMVGEHEVRMAE